MANAKLKEDRFSESLIIPCTSTLKQNVEEEGRNLGVSAAAVGRIALKEYFDKRNLKIAEASEN